MAQRAEAVTLFSSPSRTIANQTELGGGDGVTAIGNASYGLPHEVTRRAAALCCGAQSLATSGDQARSAGPPLLRQPEIRRANLAAGAREALGLGRLKTASHAAFGSFR